MRGPVAVALGTLLLCVFPLCWTQPSKAHELDSATLVLKEVAPGRFDNRFQATSRSLQALQEPVVFPEPCRVDGAQLDCGSTGLVGALEFPWLEGSQRHVMLDIEWRDGSRLLRIVTASAPSITVYGAAESGWKALAPIVVDYTWLGVEHILAGFDHLFFVIALAVLVRKRGPLIATITAFTVAHSLTLASTALGMLTVPIAPVEATIALSIVLLCAECLRPGQSLTRRAPWAVAFAFGLLHGLGFASALLDIGLPEKHVPAALLCFNVGVELGQLAVVGLIVALRVLATRVGLRSPGLTRGLIYAMGGVSAFWSLERIGAILSG